MEREGRKWKEKNEVADERWGRGETGEDKNEENEVAGGQAEEETVVVKQKLNLSRQRCLRPCSVH